MKRNMDLIRDLLIYFVEADESRPLPAPSVKRGSLDVSKDEVNYHIHLLREAQLIEATKFEREPYWSVRSLTWSGHEFLDAARDDTRWNKAKQITVETGKDLTIGVLKGVLAQLIRQAAGLP